MSRSKSKIAVTLLSALACSAGASAKNFGVKNFNSSGQAPGAVGGAAPQIKKGMPLAAKVIAGTLGTLGSLEVIHSMIGGFTDSKLGSYSIGRAIRNRVKKNDGEEIKTQKEVNDPKKQIKVLEFKKGVYYDENWNEVKAKNSENNDGGVIEACKKFAELTQNKDSWKSMVSYLYDFVTEEKYHSEPDEGEEAINSCDLSKYKERIEKFIGSIRGDSKMLSAGFTGYNVFSFTDGQFKYNTEFMKYSNKCVIILICAEKEDYSKGFRIHFELEKVEVEN